MVCVHTFTDPCSKRNIYTGYVLYLIWFTRIESGTAPLHFYHFMLLFRSWNPEDEFRKKNDNIF